MPETRKHRVQARDQIDRAIFAALGEPVLPNQPGAEKAAPEASGQEDRPPTAATSFLSGGTMGQFTFHAGKTTSQPAPDADPDADED
ncbi:hypothetical protein G7070_09200 [Propioniciclava coleopterorum]|uniref:Uncharacterized protein n=1 Tax=Propioniciclava coleopterorum TaxID=2714937 RepID=A0A6G7Y6K2_9ACTN|nr:hypothetical protein [Propioniciclava coleopterorum]QIK72413.1 hypothetical protein G7070_09200 [Propioniciclava coleopterorum]